jgi:transforming growth factor-beta-induced protein
MALSQLVFICLVFATSAFGIQKRGVVEEVGNIFESFTNGFTNSFDQIHKAAREEVSRLQPWAAELEREMKPALSRVEERLGSALDDFGFSFGNERIDSHIMDTTGMPGLDSMFSNSNLNPFELFGISSRQNWWEGPNVCIDRKVLTGDQEAEAETENPETDVEAEAEKRGKFFSMDTSFTTCRDDANLHECTTKINKNGEKKSVTVSHQCCYGHQRSEDGTPGCTKVVLEDLPTTIDNIGVEEFAELLKENGIMDELSNMTIFIPSNEAVEDFRHDLQHLNSVDNERNTYNIDDGLSYRKKRDITIVETPALDEILKAHMVEGFLDTASINDEQILETVNGYDIRMTVYNTYPQRSVMANCAKVISRDHYSNNGVAHIVDKVIMPATKSLKEMIETDVQFTALKAHLNTVGLMDKLEEPGQWTLFAPTNKAFSNLDSEMLRKIEKGNGCSKDILLHHLLPNVICTGVVSGKAKTTNINDKYIILERNAEDEILVNEKAMVINRDIMASNGVIHIIDDVLIPETARTVEEALEENHMTTLEELFKIAGMSEALDGMSNMTIFAPSERALSSLPQEMLENYKANPEQLKEFLMYHVASPKTCKCEMENNKVLKTGMRNEKLRINTYGSPLSFLNQEPDIITVQCAKITSLDNEVCGGMIHTVDKVLTPPIGNLIDLIKLDDKHKTWLELIKKAEMETEINSSENPMTMLAPTEGAFLNMDEELKKEIFADKRLLLKWSSIIC